MSVPEPPDGSFRVTEAAELVGSSRIRQTIGENTALTIEACLLEAQELSAVRLAPDPFKQPRPPEDLSFMSPKDAESLRELVDSGPPEDQMASLTTRQYIRQQKYMRRVMALIDSGIGQHAEASKQCASRIVNIVPNGKYSVYIESLDAAATLSPGLLLHDVEALKEVAVRLPSRGDTATIIKAAGLVASQNKILADITKRNPMANGKLFKKLEELAPTTTGYAGRVAKILKLADTMANQVRESGSAVFELLRSVGGMAEYERVARATSVAIAAKDDIIRRHAAGEIDTETALEVEGFLAKLVELATEQIKAMTSKAGGINAETKKFLGKFINTEIADQLSAQRAEEEETNIAALRTAAVEARDIILGGRRLGTKKNGVAKKADMLTKSPINGEHNGAHLFTPEQAGILIAIHLRKFDRFLETLETVNAEKPGEDLIILTRKRPELIAKLRDFGGEPVYSDLLKMLENQAVASVVDSVLGEGSTSAAKHALQQCLSLEGEANAPEEAVDQPLDNEELYAQLDWTVLPEGESELEVAAREIVAGNPGATIDLSRLRILKDVKHWWGADRCYYARGKLRDRPKVIVNGEEHPDEYIVLVLQSIDNTTGEITEHAIAESPISQHNALYIVRADVAKDGWRELLAVPKELAQAYGARAVSHRTSKELELTETMIMKTKLLLSCTPEKFKDLKFNGKRSLFQRYLGYLGSRN